MTDKREVELELPALAITVDDVRKSSMDNELAGYPAYHCRERQLLEALTKISQLEQQLEALTGEKFSGRNHAALRSRAELAEARVAQLEQQVKAQQERQDAEKATKDKPTFAYELAMYLTKNGRELLTIEEMQYRIENFVYRSCWEVRTK